MDSIIKFYNISPSSLPLLPARKIDYDTIVMKENKEKRHVRETPFNLIKSACYHYDWTTYEGGRQAVIYHTNFVQKSLIPISVHKDIYLLLTRSPKHAYNVWIAFHHIQRIGKVPQVLATTHAQSIVYFKNGQDLVLSISYYTLEKQYARTLKYVLHIQGVEGLRIIYPW